ncbi:MAG TPA: hypothetical protein DCP28_08190, partial [Cytophagales bacterium]|nr:hypothetical protein [Cytophagales bacterium]
MLAEYERVAEAPVECPTAATPLAVWPFDDCDSPTALDSLGNHPGTLVGATRGTGYSGAGVTFDGTNDYVDFGNDADFALGEAFTVSLWMNPAPGMNRATFLAKNREGSSFSYMAHLEANVPTLTLGGGACNPGPFSAASPLPTDEWSHLAWTLAGGTLTLYVNGAQAGQWAGLIGVPNPNPGASLWLGGRADKTDRYFHGSLDELRLWNDALTATEIQALAGQ